jgi:cytochrome c-type biogenesis protein
LYELPDGRQFIRSGAMSRFSKLLIIAALAVAVAGVLVEKHRLRTDLAYVALPATGLPCLVELDAVDCAPCRAMAAVLKGLQRECAGRLAVEVIDVRAHRDIKAAYRVRFSPTQVFKDASGAELFRHEGFMAREDILAKWRDLGYDLQAGAGATGFLARLFGALSHAVAGAPQVAFLAAFLWGVLSVLLSPCHLANVPLVIGFIAGQGRITARRAFGLSALFAVGILTMIGVVGAVTVAAGRLAGDAGPFARYLMAAVLFAVGLHFFDVVPLPWSSAGLIGSRRKGAPAALICGLLFGVALGPCTFAYLAPMVSVTLSVAATSLAYGALLLLAYGLGHCSVIVLAGTSTEWVQRGLNWNENSTGARFLKRTCGALILLGGAYLLYVA